MLLLLLALLPQSPATVGDTVWITRTVSVPAAVSVRPRPIAASPVLEALGPPEIALVEGQVRIRYPVVVWQPGTHEVLVPGAILVRTDGWSDTLPDWRASVALGSVLPEAIPRDSLEARPAMGIVPRSRRSPLPAFGLVVLALLGLWPAHWWWRRRGPRSGALRPILRPAPDAAQLRAWARAGEYRAAVAGWHQWVARLDGRDETADQLWERLAAARFSPAGDDAMASLCAEVAAWAERGQGP